MGKINFDVPSNVNRISDVHITEPTQKVTTGQWLGLGAMAGLFIAAVAKTFGKDKNDDGKVTYTGTDNEGNTHSYESKYYYD